MEGKRLRPLGDEAVLGLQVDLEEIDKRALLGVELAVGEEELVGVLE